MSKPSWIRPSRRSRAPTPARSSIPTVPSSSTPARTRPITYSRLRRSMTTASIPARCSSCPSKSPAGPEPMMATCTRMPLSPSEQRRDFLRRLGLQRALGERKRDRAEAEQAVQIEGSRSVLGQRVEVLADYAHIPARDHAAERASEPERPDVVRRALQQRQQRGERVFLPDAELGPQRDGLGYEGHDEGSGEIRPDVVERASAFRKAQGTRADRAR